MSLSTRQWKIVERAADIVATGEDVRVMSYAVEQALSDRSDAVWMVDNVLLDRLRPYLTKRECEELSPRG